MRVDILASGSSGNCAVIDDLIAIDAGYERLVDAKYLFLTHAHTDHTKHLDKFSGLPVYCLPETADALRKTYPYTAFQTLTDGVKSVNIYPRMTNNGYGVTPIRLKHDVPCAGYEIAKHGENREIIAIMTDFSAIVDEDGFVEKLAAGYYDALYIECNNTLSDADLVDAYISVDDEKPPRDEFHRRRSYQNHCNVNYLISLFTRAGYSESKRFAAPVTLLHKSKSYYGANPERIEYLSKIVNIVNP